MLTKNSKDNFQKDFFKLSNNLVFRKTMKTVTKHRNVKLVTKERSRNYLVSEPKYETTKFSKSVINSHIWARIYFIFLNNVLKQT